MASSLRRWGFFFFFSKKLLQILASIKKLLYLCITFLNKLKLRQMKVTFAFPVATTLNPCIIDGEWSGIVVAEDYAGDGAAFWCDHYEVRSQTIKVCSITVECPNADVLYNVIDGFKDEMRGLSRYHKIEINDFGWWLADPANVEFVEDFSDDLLGYVNRVANELDEDAAEKAAELAESDKAEIDAAIRHRTRHDSKASVRELAVLDNEERHLQSLRDAEAEYDYRLNNGMY